MDFKKTLKKKIMGIPVVAIFLVFAGISVGGAGCGSSAAATTNSSESSIAFNEHNRLINEARQAVGFTNLTQSEEMRNLLTRIKRLNDPNHKSYLYIYANNGAIKAYFPIVGKCTSTDSRATTDTTVTDGGGANGTGSGNIGLDTPQLDGSYGSNEPGSFCFIDDPQRTMITFNGDYILLDKFLPLKQVPELVVNHSDNTKNGTSH